MEAQFALAQLYPICKHIVIIINLIYQLADIGHSLFALIIVETTNLVQHTVYKRRDVTDKRNLGSLLQISALIILNLQQLGSKFLALLLVEIIRLFGLRLLLVKIVEQP